MLSRNKKKASKKVVSFSKVPDQVKFFDITPEESLFRKINLKKFNFTIQLNVKNKKKYYDLIRQHLQNYPEWNSHCYLIESPITLYFTATIRLEDLVVFCLNLEIPLDEIEECKEVELEDVDIAKPILLDPPFSVDPVQPSNIQKAWAFARLFNGFNSLYNDVKNFWIDPSVDKAKIINSLIIKKLESTYLTNEHLQNLFFAVYRNNRKLKHFDNAQFPSFLLSLNFKIKMLSFDIIAIIERCTESQAIHFLNSYRYYQELDQAFFYAAAKGDLRTVCIFLDAKICLGPNNQYSLAVALMNAADENHLEIAKKLISNQVDVNAVHHESGKTALLFAAGQGHIDMLKFLLEQGAKVNHQCFMGFTALMQAANEGNIKVADTLLKAGANIHLKSQNGGGTALYFATRAGLIEMVDFLLEKKAVVDARIALIAVDKDVRILNAVLEKFDVNSHAYNGRTLLQYLIIQLCPQFRRRIEAMRDRSKIITLLNHKDVKPKQEDIISLLNFYHDDYGMQTAIIKSLIKVNDSKIDFSYKLKLLLLKIFTDYVKALPLMEARIVVEEVLAGKNALGRAFIQKAPSSILNWAFPPKNFIETIRAEFSEISNHEYKQAMP